MSHSEDTPTPRKAKLHEALITFLLLIVVMFVSIIRYELDPHVPMFVGVILAALMAMYIGYRWDNLRQAMIDGITKALPSIMILIVIGMLVGIWIVSGVVPSMIYYGLSILRPEFFLIATVIVCAITSLATGSSWGTVGTMGIALMGIAQGLNVPPAIAAGAIISGAYFGDKMSPLSDTTNLAPAMTGTDVFTHIKAMMKPTIITIILTLIFFGVVSFNLDTVSSGEIETVTNLTESLAEVFTISPILLLPPALVIVLVAMKIPAIPGIVIGTIAGALLGIIFQGNNVGDLFSAAMSGYVSETGIDTIDNLLSTGGLESMMYSISLTIIAMMFGGIVEATGQLEVIILTILKRIHSLTGLVSTTLFTGLLSNIIMPEQYISIVIPGRMYSPVYREKDYHPKFLSSILESGGTVTSALIPWNTCGVYMAQVLRVSTIDYLPFAIFNILTPIVVIILVAMKQYVFFAEDDPDTILTDIEE